jgi:dTDP-4-amino-4,6-dideoxygalactose transaminase
VSQVDPSIHLSAPQVTEDDIEAVVQAMRSGWIAPVGPELEKFESEIAGFCGTEYAVATTSGTAALHLALRYLQVQPGDYVLVPTMTFAATAFAVQYLGAIPAFIDIDESWNMSPAIAETAIKELTAQGGRVRAAVPVDLYGTPCNYADLLEVFHANEIATVQDSAESLGAKYADRPTGSQCQSAALSFNGNKIMTTSGGGMLLTDNSVFADKARFWSTQSKESTPWYEHKELGYNYRMSNLLAALGRSQLSRLTDEVARRRRLRDLYRESLETIDGLRVQEDPSWGKSNAWLTVLTINTMTNQDVLVQVREFLRSHNIESRPVWKPLHNQLAFETCPAFISGKADALFQRGLCLPSGHGVDEHEVSRISELIEIVIRGN